MGVEDFAKENLVDKPNTYVKDSSELFRDQVLGFITDQTKRINADDDIVSKIKDEISELLDNHELDLDDLIKALKAISSTSTNRIDSLFNLFRPQGGQASHPLLTPPKEPETKEEGLKFTTSELKAFAKFSSVMEQFANSSDDEDGEAFEDTPSFEDGDFEDE